MDQATLVNFDVRAGAKALKALDDAKLKISVALWMVSSEYSDGRLVFSSPSLDQTHPLRSYEQVTQALHDHSVHLRSSILVLPTKDPFIRELRRIFGKAEDVLGMRLGGQTIGNRFVLDAYVYRIQ
jgi:hypothetical protein